MKNKLFKIPVSWEMYGYLHIKAKTLEEAIEIAERPETSLPTDGEYVMDSDRVDREAVADWAEKEKEEGLMQSSGPKDLTGTDPKKMTNLDGGWFAWEPGDMTRYQFLLYPLPDRFGSVLIVNLMSGRTKAAIFEHSPIHWRDIQKNLEIDNLCTIYQFSQAIEVIMGWEDDSLKDLVQTLKDSGYKALAERHR
jgi:hypothetical protein